MSRQAWGLEKERYQDSATIVEIEQDNREQVGHRVQPFVDHVHDMHIIAFVWTQRPDKSMDMGMVTVHDTTELLIARRIEHRIVADAKGGVDAG